MSGIGDDRIQVTNRTGGWKSRLALWVIIVFFAVLISPVLVLFATMETVPAVAQREPSNAEDLARAKLLYRRLISFTASNSQERPFEFTIDDLNSVSVMATRALPSVRGEALVSSGVLNLILAVRVPIIPWERWLNVRSVVQPSASGLNLSSVRLGPLELPPSVALPAARLALDVILGNGLGSNTVGSVDGIAIDQERVIVRLALGMDDRRNVARQVKGVMRRIVRISDTADIQRYVLALDRAAKDGSLDPKGSLVPYLKLAASQALSNTCSESDVDEMQSAILALALYCGHFRFEEFVGDVVPDSVQRKLTGCSEVTLDGRQDLRQHLVISAGLNAIGDSQAAFAMGEFKELLDSNPGGSGFSFDDLAADQTGIRFATTFLSTPPSQWQALINRLDAESDIFPNIASLPSDLPTAEFQRQYGDIDSPAYRTLLAEINRRINELRFFHAGDGQ